MSYMVSAVSNDNILSIKLDDDPLQSLAHLINFLIDNANFIDNEVTLDITSFEYIDSTHIGKLLKINEILNRNKKSLVIKVSLAVERAFILTSLDQCFNYIVV